MQPVRRKQRANRKPLAGADQCSELAVPSEQLGSSAVPGIDADVATQDLRGRQPGRSEGSCNPYSPQPCLVPLQRSGQQTYVAVPVVKQQSCGLETSSLFVGNDAGQPLCRVQTVQQHHRGRRQLVHRRVPAQLGGDHEDAVHPPTTQG